MTGVGGTRGPGSARGVACVRYTVDVIGLQATAFDCPDSVR
jgi:hypothetical protein